MDLCFESVFPDFTRIGQTNAPSVLMPQSGLVVRKKSHNNETGVFSNIHFDAAQNGLGFGSYTSNRKYLFSVLMIKILQMFARHMRQSVNLGSAAGGVSPLIIYI